jgi:hypothetical protein
MILQTRDRIYNNNDNNNNNNQAFYSQSSWDRLEMKSHEQKQNRYRTREKKKGKTNGDKKTNQKREKGIKR